MNNNSIPQAIIALFESERFYAEIVCNMKRVLNDKIPVAGVCIKDQIELHINEKVFAEMPLAMRVAILKHECEHLLRDHPARMKELAPDVYGKPKDAVEGIINQAKHRSMNVAADLAINGSLPNLPEWGCFPKNFDMPVGETFEWYMAHLRDNDKAKELMEFDDHAIWGESEGDQDMLRQKIKQAVNDAADRARAAGKLTHEQELLINQLNKNLVNWKAQLRRFVARTMEIILESSKKKRNRRYGIMFPGTVKTEILRIGVAIDTSGSVSDEAIHQFMAEIHNISKYASVKVVEADIEVKNSYDYNPKKKYKVKGRGGTAYKPAFMYFTDEETIDGMIYFGDMDNYDREELKKPKFPVLWAIVGNQEPPASWGSRINIPLK